MKNKKLLAFEVASFVVTVGLLTLYNIKNKRKKDEAELYDMDFDLQFGAFKFENVNDMYTAINSNEINIESAYSIGNRGYMIALLDGNEYKIRRYGGERMTEDEFEEFSEKLHVDTMYFCFTSDEYLYNYYVAISNLFENDTEPTIVEYGGIKYMDLSSMDPHIHEYLRGLAQEFYADEIRSSYMAEKLKYIFEVVKKS